MTRGVLPMPGTTLRRRSRQTEIRVLIVEDVPSDADLMIRTLHQSGLRTTHRVVKEEGPFREALEAFGPDVVLADYSLPRFSGRRALRIAQRFDPVLPVIMVTGHLKEDAIIRLVSLGLSDYVLKGHLLRLTPAVLAALDRVEAKRAAERSLLALEASERRFRAVAEATGDALFIVDDTGSVVFANPAAERMFGVPEDCLVGADVEHVIPHRYGEQHRGGFRSMLESHATCPSFSREVTGLRADGTEFPADLDVSSWEEDGRVFFSAEVRDITARKEDARTRYVLSQAVEQTVTSVVITDTDGAIEYVNPAFERMSGYTKKEICGRTPRVLKSGKQPAELYARLWATIGRGETFVAELVNRRKDGTEFIQRSTIFPIVGDDGRIERYVGLGLDVTQERHLESQFRQSQKMEAVGQLAGGIAHDFNNILTGVLTNAQLLEMAMADRPTEEMVDLKDIINAARRGASLVKRLMSLARPDVGAPSGRWDVRDVVDEAVRTIRHLLPETIAVTVDRAREALVCLLDDGGLHQALLNLATNARDAMPEGGRLAIRTCLVDGHAVIEVRDNGMGMPPEVADRVFEPFFTTKEVGKGTGLGLAMVYGFAQRVGGTVTVESKAGAGTVMKIVLPLAPADEPEAAPAGKASAPAPSQGRGSVLLAEDQADIRRVAQRVLEGMGYRVFVAADGVEAMGILARERGRLDLVVADVVMPQGGGGMLYRNSRDWPERPRFLLMSGYAAGALNGDQALLDTVPFLAKPWNVADLEAAVADAMAGETS